MSNIKKVSRSLSMNGFQGHSIGRFPLLMPFTKYKVFDLRKLRDNNPLALPQIKRCSHIASAFASGA